MLRFLFLLIVFLVSGGLISFVTSWLPFHFLIALAGAIIVTALVANATKGKM